MERFSNCEKVNRTKIKKFRLVIDKIKKRLEICEREREREKRNQ